MITQDISRFFAYIYLRLSKDEYKNMQESDSIVNQRLQIETFCKANNILIIGEYVDDGVSGGTFDRPKFEEMLTDLNSGKANTVITKDLSRLGRDMNESSYYAEKYFPEAGIRYIAINDNFDSTKENEMAPVFFFLNEMYLREGSKKVRATLKTKREKGLYCACPPYGYKKDDRNKNLLVPDPETSNIVKRIFHAAANGDSSIAIAHALSEEGVITPSKYRAYYRDNFSSKGMNYVSDKWNKTTVKRILQNRVYLGHTMLGKSQKVSIKSKKKKAVPKDEWAITLNTHVPLVSETIFEKAGINLAKGTKNASRNVATRNSIFRGLVFCKRCGHALCSGGTVYKGERDKYWYLTCTNNRKDSTDRCNAGTRIKYSALRDIVKEELNKLLSLSEEQLATIADNMIKRISNENGIESITEQREKFVARLSVIDKMITKAYNDNAEGRLSDDRLYTMVKTLEEEEATLKTNLEKLSSFDQEKEIKNSFSKFYELAKSYSEITELTRDILTTFIERIEVDAKVLPEGVKMITHDNQEFEQEINIYFKFVGDICAEELAS